MKITKLPVPPPVEHPIISIELTETEAKALRALAGSVYSDGSLDHKTMIYMCERLDLRDRAVGDLMKSLFESLVKLYP